MFTNNDLKNNIKVTEEVAFNGLVDNYYKNGTYTIGSESGYYPLCIVGQKANLSSLSIYRSQVRYDSTIGYEILYGFYINGYTAGTSTPVNLTFDVLWVAT